MDESRGRVAQVLDRDVIADRRIEHRARIRGRLLDGYLRQLDGVDRHAGLGRRRRVFLGGVAAVGLPLPVSQEGVRLVVKLLDGVDEIVDRAGSLLRDCHVDRGGANAEVFAK